MRRHSAQVSLRETAAVGGVQQQPGGLLPHTQAAAAAAFMHIIERAPFYDPFCSTQTPPHTTTTVAPKKTTKTEDNVTLGPTVREGEHVFGVAHIFASFNDTFVHITDLSGKETLVRVTGGMKVKADRDESSPYAAMLAAQDVATRCKVRGWCCCWDDQQTAAAGKAGLAGYHRATSSKLLFVCAGGVRLCCSFFFVFCCLQSVTPLCGHALMNQEQQQTGCLAA